MKTTWQGISIKQYKPLSGDASTDVVIVGGGIFGITAAYLLSQEGKSVIVIEKNELLKTTTAHTTAFITSSLDTELADLEKMYGIDAVKKIIDSHEASIDRIEKIIEIEKLDCEFQRVSNYTIAFEEKTLKVFEGNKKILNKIGYASSIVKPDTFNFPNFGALELKNQAKFHPLKYLEALRRKAEERGVTFYEDTEALKLSGNKNIKIKTKKGNIIATDVILATYNPFDQPWWYIFKKGMYRSYVIEIQIKKGVLKESIMEDDANPYHYIRIDSTSSPNHDRVIVGGSDHRKELPINKNRGWNALRDFIETKLMISDYTIVTKWTGPILESSDGLALIGRQSKKYQNRYVGTAFSGNGMTYGTLSALIVTDLICKGKNVWQEIYDPCRPLTLKSLLIKGRDYGQEFILGMKENFSHSKK